ncbi:hypothetical protein HPP92_002599 [Vanilla planifolia]|uniref:Cellulose synthase n=1 Tax=Vanilla planifolia TaxID=51239 RepID=A0A835SE26_VANPL|nr:hypothetical protein HPP92_002991 [Vanilla planifolia]KAG0502527.1 hypothetical protein HPP92_002599 [Vanilla planifolia]
MPACDGKVMTDERGNDIHPCDCRFKICRDCYLDALKDTGNCPGCKEPYRSGGEYDDEGPIDLSKTGAAPALPAPTGKPDNRFSEPEQVTLD